MNKQELYRQLAQTLAAFPEKLNDFRQEELDLIPFDGSWTPGQVAEHMILANSNFVELLNGPVEETRRDMDAGVAGIQTTFQDFSTKLKSPEFVLPVKQVHVKEQLLDDLWKIREAVLKAVENLDHSKTCTGFRIPVLGYITRLEAFVFVLYHTGRHIYQLENIRRAMVA